jgi:hypothetical protein
MRVLFIGVLLLLVVMTPSLGVEHVLGVSGEAYPVYEQYQTWRAVGPVLSIRFRTARSGATAAAAEAADLLPYFAARADSAGLDYLLIRATKPVARLGSRLGLYRSWNFRYERGENGWVSSGYW